LPDLRITGITVEPSESAMNALIGNVISPVVGMAGSSEVPYTFNVQV